MQDTKKIQYGWGSQSFTQKLMPGILSESRVPSVIGYSGGHNEQKIWKFDEIGSFYTNQSNSRISLKAGEIWGNTHKSIHPITRFFNNHPPSEMGSTENTSSFTSPSRQLRDSEVSLRKQFFPSFNRIILAISKIDLSFKKSFKLTKSFTQVHQTLIGCRIVLLLLLAAAALVDVVDKDEDEDKDENKLE